jgi:excisionase family DNA binding protein
MTSNESIRALDELASKFKILLDQFMEVTLESRSAKWMDLKTASKYTTISVPHLRRLIHQKKIKSYRGNPNGTKAKIILNRKDLDKYIVFGHCGRLTPSQNKILEDKGLNYD